jgi:diacylglycerol kinase (ATP)
MPVLLLHQFADAQQARWIMARQAFHLVFNPLARGRAAVAELTPALEALRTSLGDPASICMVERPNDAEYSVRRVLSAGCDLVVCLGGDGTVQSVVNGFFHRGAPVRPAARLGILSRGTGQGFAQSLGLPTALAAQVAVIATGHARTVDLGTVRAEGGGRERLFVNECQFGIGGAVVRDVTGARKRLGGTMAFALGTLATALREPEHAVAVLFDDRLVLEESVTGLVFANGARTGGGMRLTPAASPDDGLLDVLVIQAPGAVRRLMSFPRIYTGRMHSAAFRSFTCVRAVLRADGMAGEADGEPLAEGPWTVGLRPSALRVLVPSTVRYGGYAS